MLFWSAEAARSEWLPRSGDGAYQQKQEGMQVHSLQSGIKPPDELKDLHFGDVYMLVREATTPRAQQREI